MTVASETARESHRAAFRAALEACGISRPTVARILGVQEYLVDAWLRPGASNATPAWAVHRLCALRPDLRAALERELASADVAEELDDALLLDVAVTYARAALAIASPARWTVDGARAALGAIATVEAIHKRITPALRMNATTILRRAA